MVKSPRSQLKASDRKLGARLFASTLLVMGAVVSVTTGIIAEQSTPAEAATVAPATISIQSDAGGWSNATVSAITGAGEHSCALEEGIVYCWGRGFFGFPGLLGILNNSTDRSTPVKVLATDGFTNNGTVSAISSSVSHSCAIEAGILYCWGANEGGASGLGLVDGRQADPSSTPKRVLSGDGFSNDGTVSAVAVGRNYTCAIEGSATNGDARLYCWGSYVRAVLGLGVHGAIGETSPAETSRVTQRPVQVVAAGGFSNNGTVSAVVASTDHTCAIEGAAANNDARLYCWGNGADGRLGTDSTTTSHLATLVSPNGGFTNNGHVSAVSAGNQHTCAIQGTAAASDAVLYCWGNGANGRLGRNSTESSNVAVPVSSNSGIYFTAFSFHNNGTVSAVSAGDQHTCAIEGGVVFCWGDNGTRQLGDPTGLQRLLPWRVMFTTEFTNDGDVMAVEASRTTDFSPRRTCAVQGSGSVFCWGSESMGQLGNGRTFGVQAVPVKVLLEPPPAAPAAPTNVTVTPGFGQLVVAFTAPSGPVSNYEYSTNGGSTWTARNPANITSPIVITGLNNGTQYQVRIRAVNAGGTGNQTSNIAGRPSHLWNNGTASSVAGGLGNHSCAVAGGVVYCWGANESGQVGDQTTFEALAPKRVSPVSGFVNTGEVAVHSVGGAHSCAISAGVVFCWGDNGAGQLGDGTTTSASTPVKVLPGGGISNDGTVSALVAGTEPHLRNRRRRIDGDRILLGRQWFWPVG
jgi:alpha-tubulin suppressor-like RCC1 family protein